MDFNITRKEKPVMRPLPSNSPFRSQGYQWECFYKGSVTAGIGRTWEQAYRYAGQPKSAVPA